MGASTLELSRLVDDAVKSGKGLSNEVLEKLIPEMAKTFSVKIDEVAILQLVQNGNVLSFLYPFKLQKVGSIPMTNTVSLAVRTAREKRPEAINSFATQKHPTVFEAVDLGTEQKERNPIQKIMSAPLIADGKVVGVVQISRKGKNAPSAGPDFTIKDLTALMAAAGVLAKGVKAIPPAPPKHP
jgi:transcriptional regulator with GAF, ATPase, and Fis domain